MRQALLSREELFTIIGQNAKPNEDGTFTGWGDIVEAIRARRVMPPAKAEGYLASKMNYFQRKGMRVPVFVDRKRKQRTDQMSLNGLEAVLWSAVEQSSGASMAVIRKAKKHSKAAADEVARKAKTRSSQKKSADGQADLMETISQT